MNNSLRYSGLYGRGPSGGVPPPYGAFIVFLGLFYIMKKNKNN
uniref:Uncharacterized protein n=1 Tax=viral metagenome TaxID=1070528 RepID=A0A6C0KT24_9ZZZZ